MIRFAISLATAVCCFAAGLASNQTFAAESAVVLLYHRFGEDRLASTSISVEEFDAHIRELTSGGYTVLPLAQVVSALRDRRALPDRTVAITIDDAFASAYEIARPRLTSAGLPYTVFVSTEPIDNGLTGFMDWGQIRELVAEGVTIGHHGRTHAHMADLESLDFRKDLTLASERFFAELGAVPPLLAYPYGEIGSEGMDISRDLGFTAAFGQHSGVMHGDIDFFYLPRFAMTGRFASVVRLKLAASSLALPVRNLAPNNPHLSAGNLDVSFDLMEEYAGVEQLACFASGRGALEVDRTALTVSVEPLIELGPGRTRLNCTLPAEDGRFRWLGMQYYVSEGD